jgi:hypothetical protein
MMFDVATCLFPLPWLIALFLAPQMKISVALVGVTCLSFASTDALKMQQLSMRGYNDGYGSGYKGD